MKLIIGNKAYSSWSMRGWLAVRQSGLAFEEVVVPLYQPGWDERRLEADLAPSAGKVPLLWDGDIAIWESLAIVDHLAERVGAAVFWPEDPAARGHARSLCAEMHAGYAPLRQAHSTNYRRTWPAAPVSEAVAANLARIDALWREARTRWGSAGPFLYGAFGAADIMFAPVVSRILTYTLPMSAEALDYCAAIRAHPFVEDWYEGAAAEPWVIEQFEGRRFALAMNTAIDPVELARRLIACESVTPADGGAQAVLAEALTSAGFTVERLLHGDPPDGPITNLFATRGSGSPHFAFAGHTDVVPPGEGWSSGAFAAEIRDGLLYGRGAVDMKSAIACFAAAAARVPDHPGMLSFLITGDEEGPATYGTPALMEWMAGRGVRPDLILVGEPTSAARLGDTIKIGRRGSVNLRIEVPGVQGHVAYPQLARNPIPVLAAIVSALSALRIDDGNAWFQPSNLEVTDLDVGNPAANVIPARAGARLNIRFNDLQRGEALVERVRAIVAAQAPDAIVEAKISGEAFLTAPGALSALVSGAIEATCGIEPELSTSGGTSDARFLSTIAPTVEFGLVNATMHKLDEAVAVADLQTLTDIYAEIIRRALG